MGTSHPESRPWTMQKVLSVDPHYILDVGAGSGTYYHALKEYGFVGHIDAVEVWKPYIRRFRLRNMYRNVFDIDVRNVQKFDYDVVIFGDILEHMPKEDAVALWDRVSMEADYAAIAIPIIHYHQGEINGNPYEVHVKDDWSHEEVLESFHSIEDSWTGELVGAYWASFRK